MKRPSQVLEKTRGQKYHETKKKKTEETTQRYKDHIMVLEEAAQAQQIAYEDKLRAQKLVYEDMLALRKETYEKRVAEMEARMVSMREVQADLQERLSYAVMPVRGPR